MFSNAAWVCGDGEEKGFFILRSKFTVNKVKRAVLRVLGLGFFHCYLNGKRVGDDLFLPLHSDYEKRPDYPIGEKISHHRIYVPQFDITPLIKDGENTLALHFGGGWYTQAWWESVPFGSPKAIWRVFGEEENGSFEFCSSVKDKILPSFVKDYNFTTHEVQDYTAGDERLLSADFDDREYPCARLARPIVSDYLFSDCPADRVCATLQVFKISDFNGVATYDCGQNTNGYPVLRLKGEAGEPVRVCFSEERTENGEIEERYQHGQRAVFICDGKERVVRPLFTWFGFRYFSVFGNAEVEKVEIVHTPLENVSRFSSDNEILNWIHETFLNTQRTNMHTGLPSDCPHLERRGYTGDGQLLCRATMHAFDGEKFYEKWIEDILDCQDEYSGHVQYTAPYVLAGGGPGGWGSAIVEVPYQHYLHYQSKELLAKCYPKMLRYFEYLEAHSYADLVVSDKEGVWCLGDWCPPTVVKLPAPYVNTYFYIKCLYRCIEIAKILQKTERIADFENRIERKKAALTKVYFNAWDGNFLGGEQGANAFAVDIGLGDGRTYQNLLSRYEKLGGYDTGIFGTEILTRVLLQRGQGDLAIKLLTSSSLHSYAEAKRRGATTFWETWPSGVGERSHNHPMFGAVTACFYDFLLGIGQAEKRIKIAPVLSESIREMSGGRRLREGEVSVAYTKTAEKITFTISLPQSAEGELLLDGKEYPLHGGENRIVIKRGS